MIIGTVFHTLINSPTHVYSNTIFGALTYSWYYGFIFYGVRYAPRILFACSGFILSFKLLSFFEDKVDEIKEGKKINDKKDLLKISHFLQKINQRKK